jgi:hypothetical protein
MATALHEARVEECAQKIAFLYSGECTIADVDAYEEEVLEEISRGDASWEELNIDAEEFGRVVRDARARAYRVEPIIMRLVEDIARGGVTPEEVGVSTPSTLMSEDLSRELAGDVVGQIDMPGAELNAPPEATPEGSAESVGGQLAEVIEETIESLGDMGKDGFLSAYGRLDAALTNLASAYAYDEGMADILARHDMTSTLWGELYARVKEHGGDASVIGDEELEEAMRLGDALAEEVWNYCEAIRRSTS